MMTNAELAQYLLEKHGKDRYPTPELSYIKLTEEIGEIAGAMLKGKRDEISSELADVGLCLYLLADKLNIDLDVAMTYKVMNDVRTIADGTLPDYKG